MCHEKRQVSHLPTLKKFIGLIFSIWLIGPHRQEESCHGWPSEVTLQFVLIDPDLHNSPEWSYSGHSLSVLRGTPVIPSMSVGPSCHLLWKSGWNSRGSPGEAASHQQVGDTMITAACSPGAHRQVGAVPCARQKNKPCTPVCVADARRLPTLAAQTWHQMAVS